MWAMSQWICWPGRRWKLRMHMYVKMLKPISLLYFLVLLWLQCAQEHQTVWHSTDTPVVQYPIPVGRAFQDILEKKATAMDHALVL